MASVSAAGSMYQIRRAPQQAATVLATGTANPATCISQDAFPDFYFRVTKSKYHAELKDKLKRICQGSGTEKRFFHYDEALLAAHPEFVDRASPSLDARLDIVKTAVPELAASASRKAIAEWGRPAADITHLVVATSAGAHNPGVDFRLVQLLGLSPSVRRTMLYLGGCFAGAAALRLAKDLAENSGGARVLVVCAELTGIMHLASPEDEGDFNTLSGQALIGDGAGAVIVGAAPFAVAERPLLEIVSAAQTIAPDTQDAIDMKLTSGGLGARIGAKTRPLQVHIGDNIERCLVDSFSALGMRSMAWNDLFWVVHPGTAGILRRIEAVLQLQPDKLAASRRVLREYGNMVGATVLFVLHEVCKHSLHGALDDAGDAAASSSSSSQGVVNHHHDEWGVLMAFGPGITIETLVLRRAPNNPHI